MVNLFKEGELLEICWHCYDLDCDTTCPRRKMKTTAKEIYAVYTDSLPTPKVEYKPEYANVTSTMWGRVWSRVDSPMIEPMARQVVWRAVHNILPTRERYHRMGIFDGRQVTSPICNRCNLREVDTVSHMFTGCVLVREAWCWVRRRLLDLLPADMADLSGEEMTMFLFPKEFHDDEMVWVMATYMNWVYEEAVMKGRQLNDEHARAYMRYMFYQSKGTNMPQLGHISEITISQNQVFDNG